ncbi:SpoIIE family protein phosphatase [Streptomyces odontomachi]|uniref:SpoIIE family protein phosphatase n=1 Tax=Streptomyces odontomachi TaxID=2944940 RepID=UPI00210C1D1E|nr:SpoIIE family protein phosphatase [Streptomyces sp. ODS25]
MTGRGADPPRGETASTDEVPILELNRLGSFEWDLDRRRLSMDDTALAVFDLRNDEYDDRPTSLGRRIPMVERRRIAHVVTKAIRSGADSYGTYFQMQRRDGEFQWAHAQGYLQRDREGRVRKVYGIVRDATDELEESAPQRGEPQGGARQLGVVVQSTISALARAHTVHDVINVLEDSHDVERLGTASLLLGLVRGGHVQIVAATPMDRLQPGAELTRVEEPFPTNEAVRTLRPLFYASPEELIRQYPALGFAVRAYGVSSAAYLPLIAQAHCIGVIGLHYHDEHAFTDEERNLLLALASSIAQSLQRAMFYDEAKDLAQSLQQAMLPHSIPAVPGADVAVRYRSASMAREIGGDWYDVIPLPQGRFAAVIGDVQGHDTHAAAVMGQLRIVLRAYATEGHTPATVMARASAFLHELDTERFATCVYAEADLTTGILQLVRAGHLAPLVRLADGGCRWLEVSGGLPLGHSHEFGRPEYDTTAVELAPGQTLVLFTDGLVEHPDIDLGEGMAALAAKVSSGPEDLDELADRLCVVVDERIGEDDVALLLLRRRREGGDRTCRQLRRDVAPNDPDALRSARNMIRTAGRTLGAAERTDEIELVADELITNVLLHTDGPATVTMRQLQGPDQRLRVEVEDAASALPRRREAGESGVSGRGLILVDQLSDLWGVEPRGRGKCVWSEFLVPERRADPGAADGVPHAPGPRR